MIVLGVASNADISMESIKEVMRQLKEIVL
jgi:hypothetical protein